MWEPNLMNLFFQLNLFLSRHLSQIFHHGSHYFSYLLILQLFECQRWMIRHHHHYLQQQQGEDAGSGAVPVVPLKQLVDFRRISMQPGESKTVSFQTSPASVATVDASGSRLVLPGEHGLLVSRGAQHVADELRLTIEVVAQEPRVLSQLPL